MKAATNHVKTGAQEIAGGKIGEGVEETVNGIGKTVVEGSEFSWQKHQEAGKAAEPQAKSAAEDVRDGAVGLFCAIRLASWTLVPRKGGLGHRHG